MTKHKVFDELKMLVAANFPVLLHGERGTGKTTVIKQVAEELKLNFNVLSMTRQTTLSHIMGYMNVNGVYVSSLFRSSVEFGGMFLLDEIDAADPNVLLSLNTLENGFVSFPDTLVEVHKDFRLAATANPFDAHSQYTGRASLDAATLDRFDKIAVERDRSLEASIISESTFREVEIIRKVIEEENREIHISMRDSLRLDKRKALGLAVRYVKDVLLHGDDYLYSQYRECKPKEVPKQENIRDLGVFWENLKL